jgi:hypothetical protein
MPVVRPTDSRRASVLPSGPAVRPKLLPLSISPARRSHRVCPPERIAFRFCACLKRRSGDTRDTMTENEPGPRGVEVESVRFAVVDRPVCVWGTDLAGTNLSYLRGVDSEFFLYQGQVHRHPASADSSEGQEAMSVFRAPLALRMTYGMALESFFGLLGAVLQAPDCVFGWLSTYQNKELKTLVDRITSGQGIRALPPFKPTTWEHISSVLLKPLQAQASEEYERAAGLFARAWRKFATDFISHHNSLEYNSLKHSFRVQPGTFEMDVTHEGQSLLQNRSPLAHTFLCLDAIPGKKHHYNMSTAVSVLEPEVYQTALVVISLSIHNTLVYARLRAGDDSEMTLKVPTDLSFFDGLWKPQSRISAFTYRAPVTVDDAQYESAAEILSVYDSPPEV